MLRYRRNLKNQSRELRKNMTDSERVLWSRLRRKQLLGVQFFRQKPIGPYIVDFYAAKGRLVIEVDGSQHMEGDQAARDWDRDEYLASEGLAVLRFDSREVIKETDAVVEVIYRVLSKRLKEEIPPAPPLEKGGIGDNFGPYAFSNRRFGARFFLVPPLEKGARGISYVTAQRKVCNTHDES